MMKRGAVDVIEAAYRADIGTADWLEGILRALPEREHAMGVVGYSYRITDQGRVAMGEQVDVGAPAGVCSLTREIHASLPPEYVRDTFATLPCATAIKSGSAATRAFTRAGIKQHFGSYGVRDLFIVNGLDPTGHGVYISALLSQEGALTRRERMTWSRVAAHLAAGLRLRRAEHGEPDAVISPAGRIEDAVDAAKSTAARSSLRQAAFAIDRARSKRGRTQDDEAVELWQALVAGQWTLIDRIDSDGRRYFIARKNDPDVARHHALTRRERQVVGFAALGHSNKLIAYEMGLSVSTVGVYLDIAMEKLSLPSRATLIVAARAFGHSS